MLVTEHYKGLSWTPDVLLTSYHGIPVRYFTQGDPYHCHCHKTTRLLREKLGWGAEKTMLSFQSRFGKAPWLQPYTDKTLEKLAQNGVKNIAVITPGFAADCVETLGEIAIEGKELFVEAGGKNFTFIPCLNASNAGVAMLAALVRRNLQGWV